MRKIVIKKTFTNLLLLYIALAPIFGIMLYSIDQCLKLTGLDSIFLAFCITMTTMMTALKLTGLKMEVEK